MTNAGTSIEQSTSTCRMKIMSISMKDLKLTGHFVLEVKVIVTMPVYNSQEFVVEAMESIYNQTYPCDLVICDDASTDGTLDVIEANIKPVTHVIVNEKRLGPPGADNNAIRFARDIYSFSGKWILAKQSADDISLPDRIEKSVKYLLEHPKDKIVSCNLKSFGDNDVLDVGLRIATPYKIPIAGVVAWKSVYDQVGLYINDPLADQEWCNRCKAIKWGIIVEQLYLRRWHTHNDSQHPFTSKFPMTCGKGRMNAIT